MRNLLLLSCVLIFSSRVWAQQPAKPAAQPAAKGSAVDAALQQAVAAHAKAVGSGDFKTASSFWTPDGDFVDQTGKLWTAQELVAKAQTPHPTPDTRPQFTLKTTSLRMLS